MAAPRGGGGGTGAEVQGGRGGTMLAALQAHRSLAAAASGAASEAALFYAQVMRSRSAVVGSASPATHGAAALVLGTPLVGTGTGTPAAHTPSADTIAASDGGSSSSAVHPHTLDDRTPAIDTDSISISTTMPSAASSGGGKRARHAAAPPPPAAAAAAAAAAAREAAKRFRAALPERVDCDCGDSHAPGRVECVQCMTLPMLCCDVCNRWVHLPCIGMRTTAVPLGHYACSRCTRHAGPAAAAAAASAATQAAAAPSSSFSSSLSSSLQAGVAPLATAASSVRVPTAALPRLADVAAACRAPAAVWISRGGSSSDYVTLSLPPPLYATLPLRHALLAAADADAAVVSAVAATRPAAAPQACGVESSGCDEVPPTPVARWGRRLNLAPAALPPGALSLTTLPPSIQVHLCSLLDAPSRGALERTCTVWRSLLTSPAAAVLWQDIDVAPGAGASAPRALAYALQRAFATSSSGSGGGSSGGGARRPIVRSLALPFATAIKLPVLLAAVAAASPSLTALNLRFCVQVTDAAVTAMFARPAGGRMVAIPTPSRYPSSSPSASPPPPPPPLPSPLLLQSNSGFEDTPPPPPPPAVLARPLGPPCGVLLQCLVRRVPRVPDAAAASGHPAVVVAADADVAALGAAAAAAAAASTLPPQPPPPLTTDKRRAVSRASSTGSAAWRSPLPDEGLALPPWRALTCADFAGVSAQWNSRSLRALLHAAPALTHLAIQHAGAGERRPPDWRAVAAAASAAAVAQSLAGVVGSRHTLPAVQAEEAVERHYGATRAAVLASAITAYLADDTAGCGAAWTLVGTRLQVVFADLPLHEDAVAEGGEAGQEGVVAADWGITTVTTAIVLPAALARVSPPAAAVVIEAVAAALASHPPPAEPPATAADAVWAPPPLRPPPPPPSSVPQPQEDAPALLHGIPLHTPIYRPALLSADAFCAVAAALSTPAHTCSCIAAAMCATPNNYCEPQSRGGDPPLVGWLPLFVARDPVDRRCAAGGHLRACGMPLVELPHLEETLVPPAGTWVPAATSGDAATAEAERTEGLRLAEELVTVPAALEALGRALRLQPDARLHLRAAWLADRTYRWAAAETHCRAALALLPSCGTAALQLAGAAAQTGDGVAADAWLDRAEAATVHLAGTLHHVYEERAMLRSRAHRPQEALTALRLALALAPWRAADGDAAVVRLIRSILCGRAA